VSMEKIRIVVAGAGFGARIQVPGFRASGRFEVVALVGRDPDRLARAAARCGVERTCRSLEEALAIPGLRAVSITTPPAAHAAAVVGAARAGLHVLCDAHGSIVGARREEERHTLARSCVASSSRWC
jgi:predicted dehydrogenase